MDNTLLDNTLFITYFGTRLEQAFGPKKEQRAHPRSAELRAIAFFVVAPTRATSMNQERT
ncbi:MAG: hypothetical protein KGL01_07065 [Betaproteobacteria bacterium]|nr:hypothetical protein [Betaproteobacteria bacterium]